MSDDLVERLRESGSRSEVELHEDREEAADRIRELEAQVGDLGAIKEKAHREGYTKGKAAGDAFGAAMREYIERLEAQVSALSPAPVTVSEAARVLIERIPCDEDAIAKVQRYARVADFLAALRAIQEQNNE